MNNVGFFFVTILVAFSILVYAYWKNKINFSALLGSGVIGVVVIFTMGAEWIYVLLGFFVVGNIVSRYKYGVKERAGVAEGIRTFRNVFGNGGSALIYAIFYFLIRNPIFQVGFLGAIATAGADTFATEMGEAHEKNPRLITNLKKVKRGAPGAISFPGVGGALIGSALISLLPLIFGKEIIFLFTGIAGGFLGCNIDSVVGATIERKAIDKHMTNFLATLSGGIIAMGLFYFL